LSAADAKDGDHPVSEPLTRWEGEPVESWREAWGVPWLEVWERIGSTNDRALELAEEGRGAFSVVIGHEQTEGRGRRGASWHSPPGTGLWMSVVLPARVPFAHLPLLVGLGVAEGVERAVGAVRDPFVGIKWPNDLLVGPRKLGGILCEAAPGFVVAGIGLNVRTPPGGFPEDLSEIATSLEMEGAKVVSLAHLAGHIVRALEVRCAGHGGVLSADALAGLRGRDVLLGRFVHSEEQGPGAVLGVDADGALLLERDDGSRVRVLSGSVRPL
jgi:BirA family biotin operon repressor/biotin-[acetyl-CoA-carboxylase] ligase